MIVNSEQKKQISRQIQLNWESNDFNWFRIDFLPENIHPGVISAIQQLILSKQQVKRLI